jgi:polysaccharide deacetylase 2 family uncharacterized protein YibQ
MRMRRFKLPVLGRLTWAWLGFAILCAGAGVVSAFDNGRTRTLVAMAVEGVERIAPPAERLPAVEPEERISPAQEAISPSAISDTLGIGDDYETDDQLGEIDALSVIRNDPAADVVITVDGEPARAIGYIREKKQVVTWTPIAAPDSELIARTTFGAVPRIAADGRRPSKVYTQQFTPGDRPAVALIVGGLGINRALTERAIDELPPFVTLAFAPYAKDLAFWTKRARDAGHEILVEIPMENRAGDEETLGPAALLTTRSREDNMQRLDWILSRFGGYFGVTNYLGAKYSGDRDAMEALLARISAAGLAYIDDTGNLARIKAGGDATVVNRLIDPGYGPDKYQSKRDLEALEKIATSAGDALGKTYVHDESLDDIVTWAKSLDDRGIALAPASAVLALRASAR